MVLHPKSDNLNPKTSDLEPEAFEEVASPSQTSLFKPLHSPQHLYYA